MRFSLIVATLDRVKELEELFLSLEEQTYSDFEVIVVDQNTDDCLAWIDGIGKWRFPVMRIRSDVRHLSHARNIGLKEAKGDIIAFPDDDCVYPPDILSQVDQAFREDVGLGLRTGPALAPGGGFGSGRWQLKSGPIGIDNVWRCAIAFNLFIHSDVFSTIGGFDEQVGVGGVFGSSEETDLVLRALRTGWRGWYDISQLVTHPDKALTPIAVKRAFTYGAGTGYILRKHRVPSRIWLNFMIRAIGGCFISLARGRIMNATYYWHTLCGRVYGFSAYRDHVDVKHGADQMTSKSLPVGKPRA